MLSFFSTSRICASLPVNALFSSREIFLIWARPPPLSSIDRAPNTSSTSALRLVRATGMLAPPASDAPPALPFGAASCTYFSPRRLVCSSLASALAGSFTSPLTSMVTVAVHPFFGSVISVTRPTATSLTRTAACGTRSSTVSNSAVTV